MLYIRLPRSFIYIHIIYIYPLSDRVIYLIFIEPIVIVTMREFRICSRLETIVRISRFAWYFASFKFHDDRRSRSIQLIAI